MLAACTAERDELERQAETASEKSRVAEQESPQDCHVPSRLPRGLKTATWPQDCHVTSNCYVVNTGWGLRSTPTPRFAPIP